MNKKIDREILEKEIVRLDPKLLKTDEAFTVALILLAGLSVGADVEKIANFLGESVEVVKKYENNFRDSKIWVKNKTLCDWFDEKSGSIAFWLDVSVGLGYIKKVDEKPAKKLGKLGGEATKKKYGKKHFSEAGKKGMAKRWSNKKLLKGDTND